MNAKDLREQRDMLLNELGATKDALASAIVVIGDLRAIAKWRLLGPEQGASIARALDRYRDQREHANETIAIVAATL